MIKNDYEKLYILSVSILDRQKQPLAEIFCSGCFSIPFSGRRLIKPPAYFPSICASTSSIFSGVAKFSGEKKPFFAVSRYSLALA